MTRLTTVILYIAALIHGGHADFKKPCPVDRDICGWDLQSTYGYDQATLSEATTFAGQDAGVGTYVYDSIYNCFPDGEVGWSVWCGGGGQCQPAVSKSAPTMCRGEPVDTGGGPPQSPPQGPPQTPPQTPPQDPPFTGGPGQGGSDDGGIVWDPPIGSN